MAGPKKRIQDLAYTYDGTRRTYGIGRKVPSEDYYRYVLSKSSIHYDSTRGQKSKKNYLSQCARALFSRTLSHLHVMSAIPA